MFKRWLNPMSLKIIFSYIKSPCKFMRKERAHPEKLID